MDGNPENVNMKELLAHAEFLRNLVRGLVRAEDQVEDVIQETWLKALKHPPREKEKMRQWLGKVAKNTALNLVRSEKRQEKKKRAFAELCTLPSSESIIQQQALANELVKLVANLAEPYRKTILLRYYEGLTPLKIAALTGDPLSTVKTRLQRGLGQLRQQLDNKYQSNRRAMCLALVTMGVMDREFPTVSALGKGKLISTAFFTATLAVVALIVLPLLTYWVFTAGSNGGMESHRTGPDPMVTLKVKEIPPGQAPVKNTRRISTGKLVQGLVTDGSGRPVAGVRVSALQRPPWSDRSLHGLLSLGQLTVDRIWKERAGLVLVDEEKIWAATRKDTIADRLPVNGPSPHADSGADGRFSLGPIPWNDCWLVAVGMHLSTNYAVQAVPGQPVNLVVLPAGSLTIKVIGLDQEPIARCQVRLLNLERLVQLRTLGAHPPWQMGLTDRDGILLVQGLGPPGPFMVVAMAGKSQLGISQPLAITPGATGELTVQVQPTATIKVRTIDGQGNPVAGVLVRCHPRNMERALTTSLDLPEVITGGDGRAELSGLPAGRILVWCEGRRRKSQGFLVKAKPGDVASKTVVMAVGAKCTGLVTDQQGVPLTGVIVGRTRQKLDPSELPYMEEVRDFMEMSNAVRTGADGRFELFTERKGAFQLLALHDGFLPGLAPVLGKEDKGSVVIPLTRAGSIGGEVRIPIGATIPQGRVEVWKTWGWSAFAKLVHRSIRPINTRDFKVTGLAGGTYLLKLMTEGMSPLEIFPLKLSPGQNLRLPEPLIQQPPAAVSGWVLDGEGVPAAGVLVRARPPGEERWRYPGCWPRLSSTRTARDGTFRLSGMGPGMWCMEAVGGYRGYASYSKPLKLQYGRVYGGVVLHLREPGTINGQVRNISGNSRAIARVMLKCDGPGGMDLVRVPLDWKGRFTASALRPGKWTVLADIFPDLVDKAGLFRALLQGRFETGSVQVNLNPGDLIRVSLGSRAARNLFIRGQVRLGDSPLTGALVTSGTVKEKGREESLAVFTDGKGSFKIPVPHPGTYGLLIFSGKRGDGAVRRCQVKVTPDKGGNLAVHFPPGKIRGQLRWAGETQPRKFPEGLRVLLGKEGEPVFQAFARVDRDGGFRLVGLEPGRYRAYLLPVNSDSPLAFSRWGKETVLLPELPDIAKPGHPVGLSGVINLSPEAIALDLTIPVQAPAAIDGLVSLPGAKSTLVEIRVGEWPFVWRPRVEESGEFEITGLPGGIATVVVKTAGNQHIRKINLFPQETSRIRITP